jgi:flagella basal body P-ring formation protein FlgA
MVRLTIAAVFAVLLPAAVSALPSTQVVPAAQIVAVADKLVHELVTGPDRTIVAAYHLMDQSVPAGTLDLDAAQPQISPTYVAIPIEIKVDGRVARTIVAGYRVDHYIQTAVAAHDLDPGEILSADDLTLARVLANGRAPVAIGSLVGRRLRSATGAGNVIYVEQTLVNQLVKAGDGVILIVRDGPVALTADVVARNGGGMGDTVTIYNPQTRKTLSGIVVGQNQVELKLPEAD